MGIPEFDVPEIDDPEIDFSQDPKNEEELIRYEAGLCRIEEKVKNCRVKYDAMLIAEKTLSKDLKDQKEMNSVLMTDVGPAQAEVLSQKEKIEKFEKFKAFRDAKSKKISDIGFKMNQLLEDVKDLTA